jgi:hypothetical protein
MASTLPIPDVTLTKDATYPGMSSLQKADRFGLPDHAAQMAAGLVRLNEWHAVRRLGVIAVEDIGPADIETVVRVLIASSDKELRQELGRERVTAYLADRMARSTKSTLASDLWLSLEPKPAAERAQYVRRHATEDLVNIASNPEMPWLERACSLRALRLNSTDADAKVDWAPFNLALDAMQLSPVERLAVDLCKSPNVATGLGEFLALAIDLMRVVPPFIEQHQPNLQMVEEVLSASLDWHCAEGRKSFGHYRKSCAPIREFLDARPEVNALASIGNAVFDVEGRAADRALRSWLTDEVNAAAVRSYVEPTGMSADDYLTLKELVTDNLGNLHHSRLRVMWRMKQEAAAKAAGVAKPPQGTLPLG